ncbi:hypothetical protein AcV5_009082 [Taiwanofungus camphoratus]|nr:hypothetical protein AcV5_009082 [Antrodia cinnamomea]
MHIPVAYLTSIPIDILLQTLRHLCIEDILALRCTCKTLERITRERSVWHDAFCGHVITKGMPVPGVHGQSIVSLSAQQLERLTLNFLRFYSNWTSQRPIRVKTTDIFPPSLNTASRARNIALYFFPWNGTNWLMTFTLYDQASAPRKYIVQCWDTTVDPPKCVAALHCMNMVGATVNSDPTSPGVLALTRWGPSDVMTTSIFTISPTTEDADSAFTLLQEFPGYCHSIAFEGTTLVVSDNHNVVRLINVETGRVQCELRVPLLHDDPTLRNEEHKCLGVVLFDHYALTFCRQRIHLYFMPTRDTSKLRINNDVAHFDPIASHKWQWRIDSLAVSPRRQGFRHPCYVHQEGTDLSACFPPIDILIRFDTWFPWPVNILHHFILSPNPYYSRSSDVSASEGPQAAHLPYLFSNSPADGPIMIHSIPSPIRLFTPSDMILGRYGTALWLDAQTDQNTPAQTGDHGQRIAGKVLTVSRIPSGNEGAEYSGDDRVSPGYVNSQSDTREGPGDSSIGEGKRVSISSLMVFDIREYGDGWNRLAIDEEEGRIAVGSVDGKVSLFDYAERNTILS